MIVHGAILPSNHRIETDIAIVGGGVAGIALASQLAHEDIRVALLESGGDEQDPETAALNEGELTGIPYFPLTETRVRCLGGASSHWGGWCGPLDPEDFEQQSWVSLSGWPFKKEELDPYYGLAHDFLRLPRDGYSVEEWHRRVSLPVLALEKTRVSTILHHVCGPLNVGSYYRSMFEGSENVTFYLNSTVLRFHVSADGRRVAAADVATPSNSGTKLYARQFVLAAGGIENPRLLLLSGIGNHTVGRFFMEHPHVGIGEIGGIPEDVDLRFYQECVYEDPGPRRRGCLVAALQILKDTRTAERLSNAKLFVETPAPAATTAQLTAVWEQEPNWNSYISLSDSQDRFGRRLPRLHWELSSQDWWTISRSAEIFADALREAQLGKVNLSSTAPSILTPAIRGGHHHLGTTRMSSSASAGVVDQFCRVHEVDNLFVAGGSVFPTAGQATPTLTIAALAFRLAKHLSGFKH
jgi:choline dehydrogenase-like flavoprotein